MKLFVPCALLALATFFSEFAAADSPRPNIVLILCDDLGNSDVGFNGAKDIRTPELDRLAQEGTVFTSAYVAHPFCGPSRMALMTGRSPHDFGAPYNLPNSGLGIEEYNRKGIDVNEVLISTQLQRAGYHTGAIGKWHMGIDPPYHPNARGFEQFYGFLGGGHRYFPHQYRPIYERQTRAGKQTINDYLVPMQRNGERVEETEYLTDAFSREAVRFIDESSKLDRPFFLYVAYNAPHSPLEAKDEDLKEYTSIKDQKRRTFAAMVHAVDRGVGRMVEALKSNDSFQNTLIVFLSDNGGKLSLGGTNRPLRDGKGSVFEGGHRVPMLMHWPNQVPAGERFEHPVSALDFYPTFAGLADAEIPESKRLDGKDIWGDLTAGRNPRSDEMLFVLRHRAGFSDVAVRQDQWKACRTNQTWKLFNIIDDIGETKDLSDKHPEIIQKLVAGAEEWSRSHTEPRWYDDKEAEEMWKKSGMPNHDATYTID